MARKGLPQLKKEKALTLTLNYTDSTTKVSSKIEKILIILCTVLCQLSMKFNFKQNLNLWKWSVHI